MSTEAAEYQAAAAWMQEKAGGGAAQARPQAPALQRAEEALRRCGGAALAAVLGAPSAEPSGGAEDDVVDPESRVHTVVITVSEEIP